MKQAVIRCCCFASLFMGNNAWGAPKKDMRFPRQRRLEALAASVKSQEGTVFPEKPMVIVIPSYNNERWYQKNLRSVFDQKYQNYQIIYIDDCSSDKTANCVAQLVKEMGQEYRFTLICNKERRGALANLYDAIYSCNDDKIIVTLDGDDWLAHPNVLQRLNAIYSTQNVWITHGNMKELRREKDGWCIPVPQEIVLKNAFRTFRCPSHLRTFYAWLFKKIKPEDLKYNGEFFKMTWDQAMMFPMMEMAGERHAYIKEVLYIYNDITPLNDNKVNPQLQRDLETIIRHKPAYKTLPKNFSRSEERIQEKRDFWCWFRNFKLWWKR